MNRNHFLAFALISFAPLTLAQLANTTESTTFETSTGTVTVTSSQPEALPNAADYAVQIADLDSNSDGRISRREIPARHALSFEFHLVDRNHDGYITAKELAKWR